VYMYKLFEVIAWCHENNIIHADIKPDNILFTCNTPNNDRLDSEEEKEEIEEEIEEEEMDLYDQVDITLIDFGAACYGDSYEDTREIDTGTFIFFPPEALDQEFLEENRYRFSFPRDVWSAGVTLMSIVYDDSESLFSYNKECHSNTELHWPMINLEGGKKM